MPLLDVDHLVVDLATPAGTLHAVREVSFHVDRGETLCIVGETGCGKSMIALALMGLLPSSAIWRARREGERRQKDDAEAAAEVGIERAPPQAR